MQNPIHVITYSGKIIKQHYKNDTSVIAKSMQINTYDIVDIVDIKITKASEIDEIINFLKTIKPTIENQK